MKIGNERMKDRKRMNEKKENMEKNGKGKVGESGKDENWEEKERSRKMYIRSKIKEMWKRKWR